MPFEEEISLLDSQSAKRSLGRFLTARSPFAYDAFNQWIDEFIGSKSDEWQKTIRICEPYAGTNSLLRMFADVVSSKLSSFNTSWLAFDLTPPKKEDNMFPAAAIKKADTLRTIPGEPYDLIVTNPPYLARNSARRRGLPFPFDYEGTGIDSPADLYQIALDTCLASAPWCAMLIPESFLTSKYDKSRLEYLISLPGSLFDDTECPVCLALFGPAARDDFSIIGFDGEKIGNYSEISTFAKSFFNDTANTAQKNALQVAFNDPDGEIGLVGTDSSTGKRARFVPGIEIEPTCVKHSSRSVTRISVSNLNGKDIHQVVREANTLLDEWRDATGDIFMTAFKGIDKTTGRYRRRLAFKDAENILAKAICM